MKAIDELLKKHRPDNIMNDFVDLMALSFLSLDPDRMEEAQTEYTRIASKYSPIELKLFSKMFGELIEKFEISIDDYLGKMYMEIDGGGNRAGQFFTPFHISELCAKLCEPKDEDGKIVFNEPSIGSGGMVLAFAKKLKEEGRNFQKEMKVIGTDLDDRCVKMAFVQFSIVGINAKLYCSDTLSGEIYKVYRTPSHLGAII